MIKTYNVKVKFTKRAIKKIAKAEKAFDVTKIYTGFDILEVMNKVYYDCDPGSRSGIEEITIIRNSKEIEKNIRGKK